MCLGAHPGRLSPEGGGARVGVAVPAEITGAPHA